MYTKTIWKDHIVDSNGNVIQQGTPVNANNLNKIEDELAYLDSFVSSIVRGESTFNSTNGRTITHNLGHTNYIVNIVPLQDTGGDLGDVYISKAANTFTVYNTGGFTGSFRYQLIT